MLNVPTLFVVFVVNFLSLGLVWTYVMRSYPNFGAARYWTAAAYISAAAAALTLLRGVLPLSVLVPLGGGVMVMACWCATLGIERFYGLQASWRLAVVSTVLTVVCLWLSTATIANTPVRIFAYSLGQAVPIAVTLRLLVSRPDARSHPGARMTAAIAALILVVHVTRAGASLFHFQDAVSLINFNVFQGVMLVLLVFLAMAWNFGFLLMAIDRLRAEVADLALLDDLTGIANRRHLLQRLTEECARSERSSEPFALLVIDLDGFKGVNDSFGHSAGDECLRQFTCATLTRLRAGDFLARLGGDEFCVVLPATTAREGAMVARHILEACQAQIVQWHGVAIPLAASIGVAQWTTSIANHAERLLAAADQALYEAKNNGKNRHAVYQPPAMAEAAFDAVSEPLRWSA